MFEFVFHGYHVAPFLGIPATHRAIELPMVIICHLTNDQIQRAALYYDAGVLLSFDFFRGHSRTQTGPALPTNQNLTIQHAH